MSQKGQDDILNGEFGWDILGEDAVVAGALGANADIVGKGLDLAEMV
jgi:hypothetical protein